MKLTVHKLARVYAAIAKQRQRNPEKDIRSIKAKLVAGIIKRTRKGQDVKLRPFAGYKSKHGVPRLWKSGKMLSGMQAANIPKGIKITVQGSRENRIASYHQHGTKYLPIRRFLGIDKFQKQVIVTEIGKKL